MEAKEEERLSLRERHERRRARSAAVRSVPLGVRVLAVLIVLVSGIGSLVSGVLGLFGSWVALSLLGPPDAVVDLPAGVFYTWLGIHLFRGSRIALDFLVGGYIVYIGLLVVVTSRFLAQWDAVDAWTMAFVFVPNCLFLAYLLYCRRVLRKLEERRMGVRREP